LIQITFLRYIKFKYRIRRPSNTSPQQLRRFAVDRLNDGNVSIMCRHELLPYANVVGVIGSSQAAVREAFLALEREVNRV
jgi:hypothetical protein